MASLEQELCRLFADVLGMPEVEPDDSFFDLGGHSLLASRLVRRINTDLSIKITIKVVYDSPTPALLAKYISELEA